MRFGYRAVLSVAAVALPVFGNSVSVSCVPNTLQPAPVYSGFPPPSGLYASCSGVGPDGAKASASAQAYLNLSAVGGYNTLTLSATASASIFGFDNQERSHSTAEFAEYLQANGPVRAGFLQVSPDGSSAMRVGFASNSFNVSGPSGSSLYPVVLAGSLNSLTFPYGRYNDPVPATLGLPFLLYGEATVSAYTEFTESNSAGIALANYSFRFFEADGVTPVAVSEVPEPSLTLMLGLLLGGSALLRHRRDS